MLNWENEHTKLSELNKQIYRTNPEFMSKLFSVSVWMILLLLFVGGRLFSQYEYGIRKISFRGNRILASDRLLKKITMYGTSSFQQTFLMKRPFIYDENILESDLKNLTRFYQQEGFLNVQIDLSNVQFDDKNRTVTISINVKENAPIEVRSIRYEFISDPENISLATREVVLKRHSSRGLKSGERFREELLDADKRDIINVLSNLGYAFPHIEPELTLYEDKNQVDVLWKITNGPQYFFGKTHVSGNLRVSENLIRKQLEYDETDLYRKKDLDKTQQRLISLGLFNGVTVKATAADSDSYRLPIQINVREAPRFTTRFGAGYGSEDKFRTFLNFQKLAFLGGARQASLQLKYSNLEPYNINLNINQPQFLAPSITLSLNPFLRKEVEPSYTAQRLGINVPLNYRFSYYLNLSVTYFHEQVDQAENKLSGRPLDLDDFSLYNKSGFILGGFWDSSNPMFNPQEGMYVGVNIKTNGLSVRADYPYLKYIIDFRRYQLISGQVWALRLKIGTISKKNTDDYVPPEERFYLGGSRSVRGWSRNTLGPVDNEGIPLGGKSVFEGSLEMRQPVISGFSSVLFLDFGTLSEESFNIPLSSTRFSPGFGLRYVTPIGPVRLDFAFPVHAPEERMKIYLDVGQAF